MFIALGIGMRAEDVGGGVDEGRREVKLVKGGDCVELVEGRAEEERKDESTNGDAAT